MKRRNKIICLALLFIIAFGGMYLVPMMMNNNQAFVNIEPTNGRFVVAAASALDAAGPNENNITAADGTPVDNHGDDLLAGNYEQYIICVNASDADGYGDIDNIFAALQTGAGANVCVFEWARTGANTLTEGVGAANVVLGTWSNVTGANDVDIMIPFSIEWDMGTQTDLDLNITVDEGGAQVAKVEVNLNLDVVATTTMSDVGLFDYVDYLNGANMGTAHVTYHYTGYTTIYPLGAETDFYAWRAAVPSEGITQRSWIDTSYTDGTGVAVFSGIMAPDTNTRQLLNFSMVAVDNGDGANATDLNAATTYASAVYVDPSAPTHPEDDDGGWVFPPIFDSLEGTLLVGGVAVVLMTGAYYAYGRSASSKPRRRSTKRKRTTKKRRRKR
jgi:hypothetical protein